MGRAGRAGNGESEENEENGESGEQYTRTAHCPDLTARAKRSKFILETFSP